MMSSTEVVRRSGISYRQLDCWVRAGLTRAEQNATGSGSRRRFTERQLWHTRFVAGLSALGARGRALRQASEDAYRLLDTEWHGVVYVDEDGYLTRRPTGLCRVVDLDWCAGRVPIDRELVA